MGIVIELQHESLENKSITDLVRKAYIVAKKLELNNFAKWLYDELNGYKHYETIPKYREVLGKLVCYNPVRKEWIPAMVSDSSLDKINSRKVFDSIGCLEKIRLENNEFALRFSNEQQRALSKAFGFYTEYMIKLDKSCIDRIMDSVRNNILEWTLKLEKIGIEGDNMTFNNKEKELAKSNEKVINNIHVNGNFNFQQGCTGSMNIQNNEKLLSHKENEELKELLVKITEYLDSIEILNDSKKKEIQNEVATIKENRYVNKGTLHKSFSIIKNILMTATGNVIASGLSIQIENFLKTLS